MKLYELYTSDGEYEDFREYVLYRNTDKNIVYESRDYETLSDEKWNAINNHEGRQYKIQGLSEMRIREIEYDNSPNIKKILDKLGL